MCPCYQEIWSWGQRRLSRLNIRYDIGNVICNVSYCYCCNQIIETFTSAQVFSGNHPTYCICHLCSVNMYLSCSLSLVQSRGVAGTVEPLCIRGDVPSSPVLVQSTPGTPRSCRPPIMMILFGRYLSEDWTMKQTKMLSASTSRTGALCQSVPSRGFLTGDQG